MNGIDIGLYDYDRYNTLYYFAVNAEEQIYLRYGGRDQGSAMSYLDLDSMEVALEQGLELHQRYLRGEFAAPERPAALFPREIPALFDQTIGRGRCVECHLIGDLQNVQRQREGVLDKISQMYRSPNIKSIGIYLDVPKGLVVRDAIGAVGEAGMRGGDRIVALNGRAVWTFGDLQHAYDQVDRVARSIEVAIEREGSTHDFKIELPRFWWRSDLSFRHWSVEPRVYFRSSPLSEEKRTELGLAPAGFASEVSYVDSGAALFGSHELKRGDIIVSVDGVTTDEIADTPELYIKLRKTAGVTVGLDVIRDGERSMKLLKTITVSFRK